MLILYRLKAYSVKSANRAAYIPMSKDRGFTRLLIKRRQPMQCALCGLEKDSVRLRESQPGNQMLLCACCAVKLSLAPFFRLRPPRRARRFSCVTLRCTVVGTLHKKERDSEWLGERGGGAGRVTPHWIGRGISWRDWPRACGPRYRRAGCLGISSSARSLRHCPLLDGAR